MRYARGRRDEVLLFAQSVLSLGGRSIEYKAFVRYQGVKKGAIMVYRFIIHTSWQSMIDCPELNAQSTPYLARNVRMSLRRGSSHESRGILSFLPFGLLRCFLFWGRGARAGCLDQGATGGVEGGRDRNLVRASMGLTSVFFFFLAA